MSNWITRVLALTAGMLAAGVVASASQALADPVGTAAAPAPASVNILPASPAPPEIPPPHCVPKDQADPVGTYEWEYDFTSKLGDRTEHHYWISYTGNLPNPFAVSRKVSCSFIEPEGRVGSGLPGR